MTTPPPESQPRPPLKIHTPSLPDHARSRRIASRRTCFAGLRRSLMASLAVVPGALWFLAVSAHGQDWPQFLGPTRNGVYTGPALTNDWPKEGPPVLWSKKIGSGYSGPVVAGERLVLLHQLGGKETVECLEAATGKSLWSADYPTG